MQGSWEKCTPTHHNLLVFCDVINFFGGHNPCSSVYHQNLVLKPHSYEKVTDPLGSYTESFVFEDRYKRTFLESIFELWLSTLRYPISSHYKMCVYFKIDDVSNSTEFFSTVLIFSLRISCHSISPNSQYLYLPFTFLLA